MKKNQKHTVVITESADDMPADEVLYDELHFVKTEVDVNENIYLNFSSRLAMYDFARAMLHEAVYGQGGQMEFYPLQVESKLLVVNGVRMSLDSSRLFVFYDDLSPSPQESNG